MAQRVLAGIGVVASVVLAFHAGCGASGSENEFGAGANSGEGGSGEAGTATAGFGGSPDASHWPDGGGGTATGDSGGSTATDGSSDVNFRYDAPDYDGSLTQDSACVTETAEATPVPLDVYLMLDKSSSMGTDCNVGATTSSSWCRAINSIAGFVGHPTSAGMRVALDFFSGDSCDANQYANPSVGLGLLDGTSGGHAQTLVGALNGQAPSGMTPTEAALQGMITFTGANQTAGRAMIGVLITDGLPTRCTQDANFLAGLAASHFASTGIRTFVVGMASALNFDIIETIAVGGGAAPHNDFCHSTTPCHHYDVGNGDPQAFIQALQQISQSAIGCQFQMPTPGVGVVDPEQVKIEYTPGGTGTPQEFERVVDAASCTPTGFYYDDNNNPTTLTLCPDACATVQADQNAKVEVLLGCLGS